MAHVLIAADLASLRAEVRTMVEGPEMTCEEVSSGPDALERVRRGGVDVVVCDLQMGTMGGLAVCSELRNEESYGALEPVGFLLLLDRRPDVFLAQRVGVDGYVIKPLDALRVRRALRAVLADETYEDRFLQPATLRAGTP
ncbi:MAG: response regulator transcription factor [Acidimicrobiaceae bacterium]|nr:response regulator transcription factor [Acidimicrobiaceae bacterium]